MTRVVVVGSGIEGCIAALTAQKTDADVTLVTTAPDRYQHEPGTIDVLGNVEKRDGPLERPLFGIRKLSESHPYRVLGKETLRDALTVFDDALVDDAELPYQSGGVKNALVPTATGTARPTSRYPAGIASGLVSSDRPMRLVGFEQVPHFDAELLADRLNGSARYDVTATTIDCPIDVDEEAPVRSVATALDENRETADGTPARTALTNRLRPELDIEPRIGVPALLGLTDHERVRTDLESRLQAELFEIPVGEPSLPGLRLRDRLFEILESAGVERIDGGVSDIEADGERVTGVQLDVRGQEDEESSSGVQQVAGDAFVLATGGIAAGGLVEQDGDIVEPVFDCPVSHPDHRLDWSEPDPFDDHPFARFGLDVGERLQPRGPDGCHYENLYASGTVLGGHNVVRERSRGGVAIVTGYQAATNAVEDS